FRRLFGEGGLTTAFLPEFVRVRTQYGHAAAVEVFSEVAWRVLKLLSAITVAAEVILLALRFLPELSVRNRLLCDLSMIMMPYMLLICMAGLYCAALNGIGHFTIPALLPILLNVVWLVGAGLVVWTTGDPVTRIVGMSVVVVIGGIIQVTAAVGKRASRGIRLRRSAAAFDSRPSLNDGFAQKSPDSIAVPTDMVAARTNRIFVVMWPVLAGLSISQINGLVDSALAWGLAADRLKNAGWFSSFHLPQGTAAALYLGQRLFQFPLGVFAVALGTVLFPRFTSHAQTEDRRQLQLDIIHGLQLVCVVGIPAAAGLWMLAQPISDLLFRYARFDAAASALTAEMIRGHAAGVWAFSGLLIVNRIFYATDDQHTPMRLGLVCVGINLILDIALLPLLGGFALPLAGVLAATAQFVLATEEVRRRFFGIRSMALLPVLTRVIVCSAIMSLAGHLTLMHSPDWFSAADGVMQRMIRVVLPMCVSAAVYAGCLTLAGLSPIRLLHSAQLLPPDA
ncbi:MAG: polysaccharide biosynthesis protein, partial [Planctomycetaceae bacterium]|nr:polysaccharide biosynthesis protein [Planctomycetaceae bacterium]